MIKSDVNILFNHKNSEASMAMGGSSSEKTLFHRMVETGSLKALKILQEFSLPSHFRLTCNIEYKINEGDQKGELRGITALYLAVDKQKTENDDVYAEVGVDEIKYFPPIEFYALVKIEEPKNSSYKGGLLRYNEPGNMTLSVYIKHLEELKVDIKYGDFIGYPESETRTRYYNVSNDGKVTSDNKHNMFGYKPYYRNIVCTAVQDNTFRGV